MAARPRELLASLGLVALADVPAGFAVAMFFVVAPALVVLAARGRRMTSRVCVVSAMLAAIGARCAYAPTPGTVALGVAGVFVLAITMRTRSAFLTDVALSFGATLATLPRRYLAFARGVHKSFASGRGAEGGGFAAVAIPVALVGVFVALFGLANPVVASWIVAVSRSVSLPPLARVALWAVLLGAAVLLLRPALRRRFVVLALNTDGDASPAALATARNALYALNALFFAYNALDARVLWAGSAPPGMSERAYAHEGAAWLTVAIAALTVVVGVMFRAALAHDVRARTTRALAFVWLGQGLVLALGTYRRLFIHITTSGLSSLRILGIVGTSMVVVALVQMGMKLWRRLSFAWLLRRQLDAVAFGLLAFSLLPTHRISAPFNVRRVMAHDYQALVNVEEEAKEAESAAALLPLLAHDDERIRAGVAALLLGERDALRARSLAGGPGGTPLATTWTLRALAAASPRLDAALGDVARSDAITPFEYIRNSSIEGTIASSEISKVELAPTAAEKLAKENELVARWIDANTNDGRPIGGPSPLERPGFEVKDIYVDTVVIDGVRHRREEVVAAKAAMRSSSTTRHIAGPFTLRPTPDITRVEATLRLTQSPVADPTTSTTTDVVLVLVRELNSHEWKIVEERGVPVHS